MRHVAGWLLACFLITFASPFSPLAISAAEPDSLAPKATETDRPNIVLIFADDQGYADVGCFGAKGFETPNLDRLATQGARFTSFYVSQAVCGASRASLLTGCYANRVGIYGAPGPSSKIGISDSEVTIAEMLKQQGYATGMYGKWHLGHLEPFLPPNHGFDEYFGLPYSNDMWPHHPTTNAFPDLPLIEGTKVINPSVTAEDQTHLTTWYTERAVDFIDRHQDEPFFLYVAHAMPHVPLFCTDKFMNSSEQGRYGDVIQEIDWSVGQIISKLDSCGLSDNTLIIYTSDNGPWLSYGNHAGSALPLREGKGTAWEGGVRVPCLMKWPTRIPQGLVVNEMAATIDVLPTLAEITDAKLPDHKIDGLSILNLMTGQPGAKTPHDAYYYFYAGNLERGAQLQAVRSGPWKLVFPHGYRSLKGEPGNDGIPGPYQQLRSGLELYQLEDDVSESRDLADEHPEVVKRLQALADAMRQDLGDALTNQPGTGRRQPGRVTN